MGKQGKSRIGRAPVAGAALLALLAALLLAACGGSGGTTASSSTATGQNEPTGQSENTTGESAAGGIAAAPAFSSDELSEQAGENWITNGGSLTNDRFSSLDEINASNVKELKGDWMTKIGQDATAAKFSAEGTALEYKGTIYISDGADNVYALDAGSGKILWTYEPKLPADPLGEVVCCGWDNRGVALGDGMVYISQLNGDQVALDQQTGKVKWSTPVVEPGDGFTITSAPLYYDGRVYVGGSGGEYGIRGRLTALDAKTGKLDWRFYTIPGPGETGHETWPAGNEAWKHGGAGIWNTPTVDPKLNMVYFSTSNAAPDAWGGERAGDNLFSASIVAVDAETGGYKWHYQQVHHDLWDYDSPSPTVLFDGEMEGRMVEAVGEPSKTGWVYIVDRKTGKPIFPIPEVKVAQDPKQKTSPTQPEPTLPPFAPVFPTKEAVVNARTQLAESDPTAKLTPAKIFTPGSTDPNSPIMTSNGGFGGDNWPPSSYDAEKDMYFVCSQAGAGALIPEKPVFKKGAMYTGFGSGGAGTGFNAPGQLTAYDLKTGKIAWQDHFKESCYSGTVSTAGGLIFVGQNNGELQAFDSEDGKELWHFQTGAGANTTVTVFEDEGEEKVAIYAGGNSLAATPHGENFWVFSLTGTMEEEKGTEMEGAGTQHAGEEEEEAGGGAETQAEETTHEGEEEEATAGAAPDASAGKEVFAENCSTCHGATGHGGNGGPDLTTMPKAQEQKGAEEQVANGGGGMPAFKGSLSGEEIANVAAYVVEGIVGK